MILKSLLLICVGLVATAPLFAKNNKEQERLHNAGVVMQEIMNTPENIPQEVLEKAECVIVFPSVLKAAFVVGASYGRGAMVCRTGKDFRGPWGAPAMYALEGGSVGFQIGGAESDVVMLVMNERGMQKLMQSKFTLGGEGEVAAGPVGRNASAQTDALMRAEMLSWSRSRGIFAGISLQGATLRQDLDDNKELYGKAYETKDILNGNVAVPGAASKFISLLGKYSARKTG
jgi:lipid-binding SYLF domain-containing protein